MRKDLGYDFCRNVSDKNPLVAGPLKRTDCSLVSDGAAALVLADVETALALRKAVAIRGVGQVNDFLPMRGRDIVAVRGLHAGVAAALGAGAAQVSTDLSFVETHDCFTIAELHRIRGDGPGRRPGRARHRSRAGPKRTASCP